MKAYLLAAGYATRLHPLTLDFPKPLLDVGGAPILSHILARLVELPELREVVVVSNGSFAGHFEAWAAEQKAPVPIRVLDDGTHGEAERLGAVGDLAFALERSPPGDQDWVVTAGDNLLEFDMSRLYSRFRSHGAPMIALRERKLEPGPSRYNEVHVDAADRVTSFREKPDQSTSPLASIVLYFLTAEVVPLVFRYLDQGGNPDAPGHFVEWLVQHADVYGARIEGEWFDIGTHDTLAEARRRFASSYFPSGNSGRGGARGR